MKFPLACFITLTFLTHSLPAQNTLLFSDDFEEAFTNDAVFSNWTSENLEGWHYWHLIPWNGNPGQCMRFENSDQAQDDWLVTKRIDVWGITTLYLSFDMLRSGQGSLPGLFFTTGYNGNAAEASWTEIEYTPCGNENEWCSTGGLSIECPGEEVWLAFRYRAGAGEGVYFLLDNFSLEGSSDIGIPLAGSSEYFSFYSELAGAESYWGEVAQDIDGWYRELCSFWDRPLHESLFSPDADIKIYLTTTSVYTELTGETLPAWKCGSAVLPDRLFLVVPDKTNDRVYGNSFRNLVKNSLGQLMLKKRDLTNNENFPDYFYESFGMYYSGMRPGRENLIQTVAALGREPVAADITAIDYTDEKQIDLLVSYIESQVLVRSFQFLYPDQESVWNSFLRNYYLEEDENLRLSLRYSSPNFDFYAAPSDAAFLPAMAQRLEELLVHYTTGTFQLEINNRFNVVIYPNTTIAADIHGNYSMGITVGGDNFNVITPNASENPEEAATGGLIAHEFWHVVHYHLRPYNGYPGGYFIMEGMADFMASGPCDMSHEPDLWKIEELFSGYYSQNGSDPSLEYIMNNPQQVEPYLFGQIFFNFLIRDFASYEMLRQFFVTRCDWSVFELPYEEIENRFIHHLKSLVNFSSPDTLLNLPFSDPFDSFRKGWTRPGYNNPDNWRIDDGGVNNSNCARFYTYSDNNEPIESWLISPPLNTVEAGNLSVSFDFTRYGAGVQMDLFCTGNYNENPENTSWTHVKSLTMPANFSWLNTGSIDLSCASDTLYLGLRAKLTGEQHLQLFVDNFEVEKQTTGFLLPTREDGFGLYPNPFTGGSGIYFENPVEEGCSFTICDIQGRVIYSLSGRDVKPGLNHIPAGSIPAGKGIYICKLKTGNGVLTEKLIVNR